MARGIRALDVRFAPETGQIADILVCPLSAISGLMQCNGYRAPRQWSSRDRLATGASSAALIQSLLHVGRCSRFSVLLQSKIAKSQGPLMHKLSFGDAFHAGRLVKLLTIAALAVLGALECPMPTLTSKEGVLEVRLTARQGQAALDTVATPVQNFLLFDYEVI